MVILTDCDGVLVDWMSIYHEWMEGEGHKKVCSSYELHERYGLEEETSDKYMRFFNMSAEIEFLPPLRDSVKYVRKMHENHGAIFHCITALGPNKRSHILRKRNLENLFGKTTFREIDCVERGSTKKPILERYRDSGTIWVEDSVDRAIEGYEMGLNTYLMNHDHNHNVDIPSDITRVYNWREIYEEYFV
jgi:beta-phosphoglucomutase-like phosphatase (HAD superfamily)